MQYLRTARRSGKQNLNVKHFAHALNNKKTDALLYEIQK